VRKSIRWAEAAAVVAGLVLWVGRAEVAARGAELSDSKVKVTAKAEKPHADGTQVVTVTLDIEKDWHTYANPVGNETLARNATKVTLDKIKADDVQIEYPAGKLVKDPTEGDYYIYEGQVEIKAKVKREKDDTAPLKLKVHIAACNDKKMKCLPAATVELTPK
jgi:hypothetical protein